MDHLVVVLTKSIFVCAKIELKGHTVQTMFDLEDHFLPWTLCALEGQAWLEDLHGDEVTGSRNLAPLAVLKTIAESAMDLALKNCGKATPDRVYIASKVFLVALSGELHGVSAARQSLAIIEECEYLLGKDSHDIFRTALEQMAQAGVLFPEEVQFATEELAPEPIDLRKAMMNIAEMDPNIDPIAKARELLGVIPDDASPEMRREAFQTALRALFLETYQASHVGPAEYLDRQAELLSKAYVRVVFDHGFETDDPNFYEEIAREYNKLSHPA
jgi:hypothetical protein